MDEKPPRRRWRPSPHMAAMLNFFAWGLGYVYGRKKVLFGLGIVASLVIAMGATELLRSTGNFLTALYIFVAAWFIASVNFAYDAYKETKKSNSGANE